MEEGLPINVNDFVWAKMTGYSYWPAIVMEPNPIAPAQPQANMQWVYFFGSYNYAWIHKKFIKPYSEYKKQFTSKCSQSVLDASEEVKWHIRHLAQDPEYQIDFVEFTVKEKPRPKSSRSRSRTRRKSPSSSVGSRKRGSDSGRDSVQSSILRKRPRSVLSDEPIDNMDSDSEGIISIRTEEIKPIKKLIGVLACNIYGEAVTKNLIGFGHNVLVWCPSEDLCNGMKEFANSRGTYFKAYGTMKEVVERSAIIFSCFSSCLEARAILHDLGVNDRNDETLNNKTFIEMSTIDHETSIVFDRLLGIKATYYMEAMIQGTRREAEEREIAVLVAGKRKAARRILAEYNSCFWALAPKSTYSVGEIGTATQIHAIIQMMKAVFLAGFTEALALADKCIDLEVFFEIFELSQFYSAYFDRVCETIRRKDYFNIQETIQELQQGLTQILETSNKLRQQAPMASTANQLFKHARRLGFDDRDSACMFLRAKH